MILLTKFKLKQQSGRQSPLTVLKCFQGFARQTILQIQSQGTPNSDQQIPTCKSVWWHKTKWLSQMQSRPATEFEFISRSFLKILAFFILCWYLNVKPSLLKPNGVKM